MGRQLGDVARKDRDKEGGHDPADLYATSGPRQECRAKDDLDDPRGKHNEIRIKRHPTGHLGEKGIPIPGQVADAGENQRCSKRPAPETSPNRLGAEGSVQQDSLLHCSHYAGHRDGPTSPN